MNRDHGHSPPSLRAPWWEWACPACTPKLYDKVVAPDPFGQRGRAVCPFCMQPCEYGERFPEHSDDSERCRTSGLSVPIAKLLLAATLRGDTVADWLGIDGREFAVMKSTGEHR